LADSALVDTDAPPVQAVNPDFAPMLELMPDLSLTDERVVELRNLSGLMPSMLPDGVEYTDHVVDEDAGVIVRVYRRVGSDPTVVRPGVYSIHGGGYVLGDFSMDDARAGAWSAALDCVGFSVEYRLAPDHPYPVPLEDCYTGLQWVHDHAAELGVDPARLGIAGLSAGGGLAAALALLARDRGELPVAFQLLDSPMLDDRQQTPSSQGVGLPVWSRESNAFGWQAYLGELAGGDVPYCAAPARANDLRGLPPAFVCVGTVDGFRDEDIHYALRLNQAGVPTELHVYPGAPHGFGMFPGLRVAEQVGVDIVRWLAARFAAGS
jgi:acetyl esterase/lipase